MSDRARKQASRPEGAAPDGSGPFRIHAVDEETMLPPAAEDGPEDYSLASLGEMVDHPPLPIVQPPAAERGKVSGMFESGAAGDSDLEELMESLEPYHQRQLEEERAELQVEDLSLRPGNPYLASSLVPPAEEPFPWGKLVMGAGAAFALGAAAFVVSAALAPRSTESAAIAPVAAEPVEAQAAPSAPPVRGSAVMAEVPAAPVAEQPADEAVEEMAFAVEDVAPEKPVVAAPAAAPKAEAVVAAPMAPAPTPVTAPAAPAPVAEAPAAKAPAAPPATQAEAKGAAEAALAELLGKPEGAPAAPEAAAPAPAPAAPAPSTEAAPSAEVAAPAAPAPLPQLGALPSQPTRDQVVDAVEKMRPALQQCAGEKHGIVKFQLTVRGTGRVSSALIDGVFKGTPEGSCMARAMRKAAFPQFSDSKITLQYPMPL